MYTKHKHLDMGDAVEMCMKLGGFPYSLSLCGWPQQTVRLWGPGGHTHLSL